MPHERFEAIAAICGEFVEPKEYVGAAGRLQRSDVKELPKAVERRSECCLVESGLERYFATNAFQVLDSL